MTESTAGWKFGADIKQEDGHYKPFTCYVAVADQDAAKAALSDAHPGLAFHASHGAQVSVQEWKKTFEAEPNAKEIRLS